MRTKSIHCMVFSIVSKVIPILSAIMICLQFTPALSADFTGNWSGTWTSSYPPYDSGSLNVNVTQTGTSLAGTMNVYGTDCGNFLNLTLTGSVSGNVASFNCTAYCYQNGNNTLSYTNGQISGNTITGNFTVSGPGYYDAGTFSLTRPDIVPDPFAFTDQAGVALSTVVTSNTITVSGIIAASPISITGGTYSVNGGAYRSTSSTVSNGNTVSVRVTSSGSYLTTVNATLAICGVSDTFSVTTMAQTPLGSGADFNGDGKTDIVWRNRTSGMNLLWFMNGITYTSATWLPSVSDTSWEIVGTGDFNSDGKTDIFWRNKVNGLNTLWLMDGAAYVNSAWFPTVDDTNWEIVAMGDFSGDGKTDIFWRNKANGLNTLWLMDGAIYTGSAWFPTVADTNWEIVGAADFSGDGKTDLVWRNKVTGDNLLWLMDGAVYTGATWLPGVADTTWEIVGTGDFNSDGKTDILWRNTASGLNLLWLMNGTTYTGSAWLPGVTDTTWEIVGP